MDIQPELPDRLARDLDGSFEDLVLVHQRLGFGLALRGGGGRADAQQRAQARGVPAGGGGARPGAGAAGRPAGRPAPGLPGGGGAAPRRGPAVRGGGRGPGPAGGHGRAPRAPRGAAAAGGAGATRGAGATMNRPDTYDDDLDGGWRELAEGLHGLRATPPETLRPAVLERVGLADAYLTVDGPAGPLLVAYNGRGLSATAPGTDQAAFAER